jgi:hypothetical protein
MVTPIYPSRLFGDRVDDEYDLDVDDSDESDELDEDELPSSPRATVLLLHQPAKNLVILCLVLGLGSTAINTVNTVRFFGDLDFGASIRVDEEWRDLEAEYDAWDLSLRTCVDAGPACQQRANASLRAAVLDFERVVRVEATGSSADEAALVIADLERLYLLVGQLTESTGDGDQLRLTLLIQDTKDALDEHYTDLSGAVVFD